MAKYQKIADANEADFRNEMERQRKYKDRTTYLEARQVQQAR